jgi:hypothetical protein
LRVLGQQCGLEIKGIHAVSYCTITLPVILG